MTYGLCIGDKYNFDTKENQYVYKLINIWTKMVAKLHLILIDNIKSIRTTLKYIYLINVVVVQATTLWLDKIIISQ